MKLWKISIIVSFVILFAIIIYSAQMEPDPEAPRITRAWISDRNVTDNVYITWILTWNGTSAIWEKTTPFWRSGSP